MESGNEVSADLLKDSETPDEASVDSLEQLQELVSELRQLDAKIDELEENLEAVKKLRNSVGRDRIPELLRSLGLSELKLKDGSKVVVSELAEVSVPEEKEAAFMKFLVDRKEDDIVKTMISLPKMSGERRQAVLDFLETYDYAFEVKTGVHPQTLKAYARRLLGVGVEEEEWKAGVEAKRYLRKGDVTDVMNVFTYFDTKIVEKKVRAL